MSLSQPLILIVDDDPKNIQLLGGILHREKYTVAVASNGVEALKSVANDSPDLILMDINMPEMDGFEACRRLKANKKNGLIPLIFLTSNMDEEMIEKAFGLGAVDYLSKPFKTKELLSRVNTHVRLSKTLEALEGALNEAEQANRAKSTFLSNISHEIRTPMSAIMGFSEVLSSKVKDPEWKRYLAGIQTSGKALLSLINDILDLSRMESGKMELQLKETFLSSMFEEVASLFEIKLKEAGLELRLKLDSRLSKAVYLDEVRVRQILLNLVGNSCKFTESGFVSLEAWLDLAEGVEVQGREVDLLLKIQDSGIGIAEDQQSKIFGAFEQSSGQNFSKYGGTGLGLPITQKLVNLMGGEISVDSKLREGSTFTIRLKGVSIALDSDILRKEHSNIETVTFAPAKVLIVDDTDFNHEIMRLFLEPYNFDLYMASNGREALDMIYRLRPDLVMLDMEMPEMNGYEVVRTLREKPEYKDMPMIAVTASSLASEYKVILNCCHGYLQKPLTKNELIEELKLHLKHVAEPVKTIYR